MDTSELITIFSGLLLRLAVPILVTAITVLVLRRLDLRWQAESLREALSAGGKSLSADQVRCWDVFDCPKERRARCAAYQNPDKPCWEMIGPKGELMESCRRCPLRAYRLAEMAA
jgi:hypothetical protein